MTNIPEITFTLNELEAAIRNLVEENPETIYMELSEGDCLYTQGKAGCGEGCLIGQGISTVQPNLNPFLAQCDKNEGPISVSVLLSKLGFGTADGWFASVQGYQDDDYTWQVAIEKADKMREIQSKLSI